MRRDDGIRRKGSNDTLVSSFSFKEIKLQRVNADDKLGLTLCDGLPVKQTGRSNAAAAATGDESHGLKSPTSETRSEEEAEENEVYIQAIAVNSLAAADGRLCQGDILLQV